MKKLRVTILYVLMTLLFANAVSASLSYVTAAGENWTLEENGTLVIMGIIDADEFEKNGWTPYREQIKTVRLTAGAGWMPEYVFDGCVNMTEFRVDTGCTAYFADDGVLYRNLAQDSRRLFCYPDAKTDKAYAVLEHSSIIDRAFADAVYLEKVVFPEDLYYVGTSWDAAVFENCTSLTEVVVDRSHGLYCPEGTFDGTALSSEFIDEICWNNPFTDIHPQSPYYDAVKFVEKNGLMNGMGNGTFSPDTGMTRAMFVTVLGRMAGVTEYSRGGDLFRDVEEGQWYSDYVYWAKEKGIVKGYEDGTFGVNDKVTIEQAVVMLARYAGVEEAPMYDMEGGYDDASEVSEWAKSAMRWAVATGIYDGYGRELRPKENAPRALVAQMLYYYADKYVPMSPLGRHNAFLDGFSFAEYGGQNYVTYPGWEETAVDKDYIVLFVNGSPVDCDGIFLDEEGKPIVPVKAIYNLLGYPYTGNEKMSAEELAEKLGAEYHWCDSSVEDRPYNLPYMYLNGDHITFDLYQKVGVVKSKEAAVKHLRKALITAYETRYGVDYIPSDVEVLQIKNGEDEQNWHRRMLSIMSVHDVEFKLGRYYKIPYVWDFYVDIYTDDIYMLYNGITNTITKFDPRSPGAFTFAG